METRALHIKVRHEDGALWATVDEYPGVFATGNDAEELRENLQEGIALWLAAPDDAEPPRLELGELKPVSGETVADAQLVLA